MTIHSPARGAPRAQTTRQAGPNKPRRRSVALSDDARQAMLDMGKKSSQLRHQRAQIRVQLLSGQRDLRAVLLPVDPAVAGVLLPELLKMVRGLSRLRLAKLGALAVADGINLMQTAGQASARDRLWLAMITAKPAAIPRTVDLNLAARRLNHSRQSLRPIALLRVTELPRTLAPHRGWELPAGQPQAK